MTDRRLQGPALKAVYATGAQGVSMVAGLLSAILTARLLGAEGRGMLALAGLATTLVVAFTSLGLGPALSFLAGKRRYDRATLALAALSWAVVLGGIGALVLVIGARWLSSGVLQGLRVSDIAWVAAGLAPTLLTVYLGSIMVGEGRIKRLSALQAVNAASYPVAVLAVLIIVGPDPHGVIAALTLVAYGMALAYWFAVGWGGRTHVSQIPAVARDALPYGLKVSVGQALNLAYMRADSLFLNYFAGVSAVGVYSIAITLAEKIWQFSSAATLSLYGEIAARDSHEAAALAARAGRLTLLFSVAGAVALLAISPLIPLVFGAEFSEAVWLLLALLFGVVTLSVGNVYQSYFMGQLGRPGICSAVSGVMLLVSVVLYRVLIPAYGAMGAAVASSVSYTVSLASWLTLFPRATGISPREMVVPTREDLSLMARTARGSLVRSRQSAAGSLEETDGA